MKTKPPSLTIDKILPGVGAIDIGQREVHVAVAGQPVKRFGTHLCDVRETLAYLKEHQVERVAMEATGVYWISLHDVLEEAGIEVTVFNGAHARNLPGRKTDIQDCQWHAMLHSYGLLRAGFIPEGSIRQLRAYRRLRDDHIAMAASHIQHMQKALDLMNVRLHTVISQIHGVSGLKIIRAILSGERDPATLAALCDPRILNKKAEEVRKSLEGHYQEHHLFALGQALECYEFYQEQIGACDAKIEALLAEMTAGCEEIEPPTGRKVKLVRHNAPAIEDLHGSLVKFTGGRDASCLPGISPLGFLKLLSETGPDMSPWPSAKHFTSWTTLAPGSHRSGKQRRRPRGQARSEVGQIFREAALSIARSKHLALGADYRRIKSRRGARVAIKAIARKLAVLYYNLMKYGKEYVEKGIEAHQQQHQENTLKYLTKMARKLGYELSPSASILISP